MKPDAWSIPELMQLSGGYWGACALHAAVKLDVFTPLAASPMTAEELAAARALDARAAGMLLDALAAIGLLVKSPAGYTATPFSTSHLSRTANGYMGHIIMHHHNLMAGWSQLHDSVQNGRPFREKVARTDDEQVRENFLMGMFNLASQLAPKIAPAINLSSRKRLLDLGGGPGTYALHFCRHYPALRAVVYDLPTTRTFAEKTIASFSMGSRVEFCDGDYHCDPVPSGFDVAWLSHILHADSPERCAVILEKGVNALDRGGMLLIQEFILDASKDSPPFPALFSLNMLLGTDGGQSYSQPELVSMMEKAGLKNVRRLPLELPNGAGIMVGNRD